MHVAVLAMFAAFFLLPAAVASANLTVDLDGSAEGTITSVPPGINCSNVGGGPAGPNCVASFGTFANVELKAVGSGAVLLGWAGDAGGTCSSGLANPCSFNTFFEQPFTVTATFVPTPDPPTASTEPASAGFNGDLATLNGRVNPRGVAVLSCRFEYGLTSRYGKSTPCDQSLASLGTGFADEPVTASTEPLEPSTTYHFRLFASNIGGAANGKDRTFTTGPAVSEGCPNAGIRAEQGVGALQLPDCMALEMVSPPKKGQQFSRVPSVSADGERVLFQSIATLGDSPSRLNAFGDDYVATRGSSGWLTASTTPPPPVLFGNVFARSFTPDFSRWFHLGSTQDQFQLGIGQAFQGGLGGTFSPVSPLLTPLGGQGGTEFRSASADHSHVYFSPSVPARAADAGAKSTAFLPGDPRPDGDGEDTNLYVAAPDSSGQPSLELIARDRNGKLWGGNCGARLGGIQAAEGVDLYLSNGDRGQGAVSSDGHRVYFSTRPDQPETGDCVADSKMRILVREESPTGPAIEELFQSECARVTPACSTDVGDDVYQGASIDQTKIYFTSNRQLTDTDLDGTAMSCDNEMAVPGCDLYLYDSTRPSGQRLTQVSAGESTAATPGSGANVTNAITAISADGSHVYFVARSVLTTDPNPVGDVAQSDAKNLYLYTQSGGDLAFIGTLDEAEDGGGPYPRFALFGDSGTWANYAYPVPIMGTDSQGNQVGGDGHILVFGSKAALTADDSDASRDIFRYDDAAGSLERVSKAGPGGSDNGSFDADVARERSPGASSTDYAVRGRWVSEDGETVVFSTAEALLPGDVNGVEDSYMWRNGRLFRLPGSTKLGLPSSETIHPTLSPDGSTVAFTSELQLLPFDGDSVQDVYVARVNGGFPAPPPAPICEGEDCQGAPGTVSGEIGAVSSSFSGRGNLTEGGFKPKCPKGKTRKHGKCVKKGKKKPQRKSHGRTRHASGGSK